MLSHFKESVLLKKGDRYSTLGKRPPGQTMHKVCNQALNDSFINEHLVRQAINSFSPDKAPGPDGISPRCLQNFIKNKIALKRVTTLFRAILEVGYTPSKWSSSKVSFIPKNGKEDYSNVKSWRPISLTSFFFKTLEKILLWHMESHSLKISPISKNQHGFRRGMSADTCLSTLVDGIEQGILRGGYALVVNLDIQSAFDSLSFYCIIKAMKEKNVNPKIINWFTQFTFSRTAFTESNGVKCSIKVSKGCQQGSILSPTIWSLVFDSFLNEMNTNTPVKTIGFADDACHYITGIDPGTLVDLMQDILKKAVVWGKSRGLKFVPEKTVATFFFRKRTFKEPKKLKMDGTEINFSDHTKYLGVTLDQKLNWNKHVDNKISKCRRNIWRIKNAIGSLWGPNPLALRWALNGIIFPSLSYGCVVWSRICKNEVMKLKLSRLNRLMALSMCPIRKGAPTQGLEIILGLKPIALKIEEHALKSMLNVLPYTNGNSTWNGIGHGKNSYGHLKWGKDQLLKMGIHEISFDKTNVLNLNQKFSVDLESFSSGLPVHHSDIAAYTDGSKLTGAAGYGFGITKGNTVISRGNGSLDIENSVFQSEVLAIQKCCEKLIEIDTNSVTIFSDSRSAISSLAGLKVKSKTVKNCIEKLNILGTKSEVIIKWIKAHCNHPGNEYADYEAKLGTSNIDNKIVVPPPISWAKSKISQAIEKKWCQNWQNYGKARQTKIWFPGINKKATNSLIKLNRMELGTAIAMLTGHNRLKKHEAIVNQDDKDSLCRFCLEDDESAWHIIGECPALTSVRRDSFQTILGILENPPQWKTTQFLSFLRNAKLAEINKGDHHYLPNTE